jgi:hypothetical protein
LVRAGDLAKPSRIPQGKGSNARQGIIDHG